MEAVARRTDSQTELETVPVVPPPVLRLRLSKPRPDRRVGWREDTVDNEHMNKKKSKCCCIYKKPVAFGESSSEDDEDCEHCFGHPEKRKKNIKKRQDHSHYHEPWDQERDDDGPTCSFIPEDNSQPTETGEIRQPEP